MLYHFYKIKINIKNISCRLNNIEWQNSNHKLRPSQCSIRLLELPCASPMGMQKKRRVLPHAHVFQLFEQYYTLFIPCSSLVSQHRHMISTTAVLHLVAQMIYHLLAAVCSSIWQTSHFSISFHVNYLYLYLRKSSAFI